MTKDFYPFNYKNLVWSDDEFAIIKIADRGYHCGYWAVLNTELPSNWIGDYHADHLELLNIHGGLTYGSKDGDYTVFGFDCVHAGDESNELLHDLEHLKLLCRQMRQQILAYKAELQKAKPSTKEDYISLIEKVRETGEIKNEIAPIPLFCFSMQSEA